MQASQNDIHAFLVDYSGAHDRVQSGRFKRDQIRLEFEGGSPATAKLRDLRTTCCMIDLGSSIFTLNFRDVTAFGAPGEAGGSLPVLTLRVGSLARDMNARIAQDTRRTSWFERSSGPEYAQPRRQPAAPPPEQAPPLRPPADVQLEALAEEPAPYNHVRTSSQNQQVEKAPVREAPKEQQRHSLDEIEEMLKQMWQEPKH